MTRACRHGCAACCVAPSISSPIPGMPRGKPAGVACAELDAGLRCRLFADASRPAVCRGLQPGDAIRGPTRGHALRGLAALERATRPGTGWTAA